MCRTLQGHGHWVNVLALNSDYVMRTGAFDPASASIVPRDITLSEDELQNKSLERYNKVMVNFCMFFIKPFEPADKTLGRVVFMGMNQCRKLSLTV